MSGHGRMSGVPDVRKVSDVRKASNRSENKNNDGSGRWKIVRRRRDKTWTELETLKELDAKISNLTRRCNRKFNKANTEKKTGIKARTVLERWSNPNFFLLWLFLDSRYEKQAKLGITGNLTDQLGNLIPLDRSLMDGLRPDLSMRLITIDLWRRRWRSDYKRTRTLRLSNRYTNSEMLLTTLEHDQPRPRRSNSCKQSKNKQERELQSEYCE